MYRGDVVSKGVNVSTVHNYASLVTAIVTIKTKRSPIGVTESLRTSMERAPPIRVPLSVY